MNSTPLSMGMILGALSSEERELFDLLLQKEGLNIVNVPIVRRPKLDCAPLSFTQERLWSTGQFALGLPYGNVEMAFRLRGPLHVSALKQSIAQLMMRHEILRTLFPLDATGKPMQVILPPAPVQFQEVDLSYLPKATRYDEAIRLATEAVRHVFDFAQDLLLRTHLFALEREDHLLVFTTNHLASDGWGMRVFARELSVLYRSFAADQPASLPELPIQYGDFAAWERQWLGGRVLQEQLHYWEKKLHGVPPELVLPLDYPRPMTPVFQSATVPLDFSASLRQTLRALSRQENVTLFMLLLAGFAVLLQRYSRQNDVVVGTTISNRQRSEIEGLVGNFGNNLLLRIDLSDDPSFRIVLARTQETVLEAYAHPDLPLETLGQHLREKEPTSGCLPAYQLMFLVRDHTLADNLALPGIPVQSVHLDVGTTTLDLKVDITESGDGLSGLIEYKTALFEPATVVGMARNYAAMLEQIGRTPDKRLSELPIFSRAGTSLSPRHGLRTQPEVAHSKRPGPFVAPRNDLERQVASLWEQTLDYAPISITDNFFALGGNSLVAVCLFSEMRKLFGRRFPLSLLLQAPTVERLADMIRQNGWSPSWTSLVPIQPGGTKPRFFCVHGGGGNVLLYRELARHLGTDYPFYGLQARGLEGDSDYLTTVEAMAEAYLHEVRALQPAGPYYLGGYCFGGLVAYDMAQRLVKDGQEVRLLVLIDTYNFNGIPAHMTWRERMTFVSQKFLFHSSNIRNLSLKKKILYLREKVKIAARREYDRLQFKFNIHKNFTGNIEEFIEIINDRAYFNYIPNIYPGKLTIFKPRRNYASLRDPQHGWGALAAGGLEFIELPVNPGGIFVKPYVQALADGLRAHLDKAVNCEEQASTVQKHLTS